MAWRVGWFRTSALVLAAALTACSGDDAAPPVTYDGGRDAGRRDGGGDGGGMDASVDGGGPADAGAGDGGSGPGSCLFAPATDLFELGTDAMGRQRRVSIAAAADGFLVAWSAAEGGENVFARWIPSSGSAGPRRNVTDDFNLAREPAVALSDDGFLASWVDNSEGSFELWARPLDDAGAPSGSAMRLTTNGSREEAPALLTDSPGALLAWIEAGTGSETYRKAWTRVLGSDGSASGGANEITGDAHRPTRPALVGTSSGAALAWTDSTGESPHAWLQILDADGMPTGEPQQLDSEGNVAGSVGLAVTTMGGMAAFDVNVSGVSSEIRLRPLDGAATIAGSEKPAVGGGLETGAGASIAPFSGGYVLAYRALTDEDIEEPTIRIAFLDALGDRIEAMDLAPTTDLGGDTTVTVSFDGNLMVGWADRAGGTTTLHAARVRCSGASPGVDAGLDAGSPADGGVSDAGATPMDATVIGPDGGAGMECTDDAGAFDLCACPSTTCTASSCGARASCLDDGCGDQRCLPAGHPCGADGDCPGPSSCIGGVCVPPGGGCDDSRDCPLGFACEGGTCTDRRIACDLSGTDCPYGYFCYADPALGEAFCLPVASPCATDTACPERTCRDVDGDGEGECAFTGLCATNADCSAAGQVCGSSPERSQSCNPHGPCASDADCASGWSCLDLWGDGVTSCVPDGGSCTQSSDCSEHAVCGSPSAGAAPECVSGSYG